MKILRVVTDYWPGVGGNERWSFQQDHWFSETANDEVQVVVLRPEIIFESPGDRKILNQLRFSGPFQVPDLPRVKAHQEILPTAKRLRLARSYWKFLRPWVADPAVDVVVTQIAALHAVPCWAGKTVVFEPGDLICPYDSHVGCSRSRWICSKCVREKGWRWWVRDQMRLAAYERFDLIVHNETVRRDLRLVGMEAKFHCLRFIIDPAEMSREPRCESEKSQKATVERLVRDCRHVLFQFNRLYPFKNPHLLLDVAERLPDCGVVFTGHGPDRASLEERVRLSPDLARRVRFLGLVNAACLGSIAEKVSAFVLTSKFSNYNTSLCETMSVGIAPAVAVDTRDFPADFEEREVMVRAPADPDLLAREIRRLLDDPERCRAVAEAGRQYIERHHSMDQMWSYRQRLLELVERRAK